MIDKNGVRYWGLFLVAAGIATLVVCALGLIDPELVFRYGPYAAPAAAAFMLVGGVLLETRLTYKERNAAREQTESITYDRWTRAEERQRRLNAPPKGAHAETDYRLARREARHNFVQYGFDYGFTIRALARETEAERNVPGKCVAWDDWSIMREDLIAVGVLTGAGKNTRLHKDWNRERWDRERDSLPCPNVAPPKVSIYVPHTNTTTSQHAEFAAE